MTAPLVLAVSRVFETPAERLFDAWLDPAQARRFLFATASGEVTRCEIDARPGGGFTIVDRRGSEEAVHRGRYVEIERPRRIVFRFSAGGDSEADWSRVTIEIEPRGTGCDLRLTHELDPIWAEWEARTRHGWETILEALARVTEG
jgi:uncharacterized protein YndB with AHSA1/START domain